MTIREQVEAKISNEVSAASIKQHELNSGEVFWNEEVSTNTWLEREDGSLTSIYRTGTGSCKCNCDACAAGDNPSDWAGDCDGIGEMEDLLLQKLSALPLGFFADELAN
jgi:hypothetical protein